MAAVRTHYEQGVRSLLWYFLWRRELCSLSREGKEQPMIPWAILTIPWSVFRWSRGLKCVMWDIKSDQIWEGWRTWYDPDQSLKALQHQGEHYWPVIQAVCGWFFGGVGNGTMMGTESWNTDRLKIFVKTLASCSAQFLSTRPEKQSGPTTFLGLTAWSKRLTSCSSTGGSKESTTIRSQIKIVMGRVVGLHQSSQHLPCKQLWE